MKDLENSLIEMGATAPELRENLRPIIAHLRTAAKLDVYSKWNTIVRKHEQAEAKELNGLLKSLVPYLKSVGLDLDLNRSSLGKYHHGSDGLRMEGILIVQDRPENTVPTTTASVRNWVEEATGLYGSVRELSRGGWQVDISES